MPHALRMRCRESGLNSFLMWTMQAGLAWAPMDSGQSVLPSLAGARPPLLQRKRRPGSAPGGAVMNAVVMAACSLVIFGQAAQTQNQLSKSSLCGLEAIQGD